MWVLLVSMWACKDKGPDDKDPTDTDTAPDTDDTDGTDTDTDVEPVTFVVQPTLRDAPNVGLTKYLDLTLSRAAEVSVDLEIDGLSWTVTSPEAVQHSILLLGLHPDADLVVEVNATTTDGASAGPVPLSDHTDPLPTQFWFDRRIVRSDPTRMEPGVTVFGDFAYIVMVDHDGTPCWYMPVSDARHEIAIWPDNHLAFVAGRNRFDEFDLAGNLQLRFTTPTFTGPIAPQAIPVDVESIHHDMRRLPNGNLLTLSVERRQIDFRTSETDPLAPTSVDWVAGETIVEIDPSGAVVEEWKLHDLLDTDRIGYDSVLGDFWESWAPWQGPGFVHDWVHANSVDYDPATDTILVSLRHQDAIVAISRASGEVQWIIAPPANWNPPLSNLLLAPAQPATFTYLYHQHTARFLDNGDLLVFDNGNRRASAFETPIDPVVSRVIQLRPNLAQGTFSVQWEWGSGEFSSSLGGADLLPETGNRLVSYGTLLSNPNAKVYEVTEDGAVVWEAALHGAGSWFRAHRLTGVIPGPGR